MQSCCYQGWVETRLNWASQMGICGKLALDHKLSVVPSLLFSEPLGSRRVHISGELRPSQLSQGEEIQDEYLHYSICCHRKT